MEFSIDGQEKSRYNEYKYMKRGRQWNDMNLSVPAILAWRQS